MQYDHSCGCWIVGSLPRVIAAVRRSLPLLLWAWPGCFLLAADAVDDLLLPEAFGLHRLAVLVHQGDELQRYDFAWAALSEMAEAFAGEAERARRDASRGRRVSWAWIRAVDAYSMELSQQVESIPGRYHIAVLPQASGQVDIQLDQARLVVSAPRVSESLSFQQRIIDRYCDLQDCRGLNAMLAAPTHLDLPLAPPAADARPQGASDWQFSAHGVWCRVGDLLQAGFADAGDLAGKRFWCDSLASELWLLAGRLSYLLQAGQRVEPLTLTIGRDRQHGLYPLTFNRSGEHTLLNIPLLAANDQLLRLLPDWLRHRLEGRRQPLLLPSCDRWQRVWARSGERTD